MLTTLGNGMQHLRSCGWRWLLCLAIVVGVTAADTTQMTTTTTFVMPTSVMEALPTEATSFYLDLIHRRSSTSSITIEWLAPSNFNVTSYQVKSQKKSGSQTLVSQNLPGDQDGYEIVDLLTKAEYTVCIIARLPNNESNESAFESPSGPVFHESCLDLATIDLIRLDSVLAVLCALGYIVLMAIIGVLCWQCAKKKKAASAEKESEGDLSETDEEEIQPYLSAPNESRPRSIIEEEYDKIPFITPPKED